MRVCEFLSVCVSVCGCVGERERDFERKSTCVRMRDNVSVSERRRVCVLMCVSVCVFVSKIRECECL